MVIHITTLKAIGKRDNLYCIASSYCSFWRNLMVCQKRKLIDRKIKDRALYLINRIISGAGRRSHLFCSPPIYWKNTFKGTIHGRQISYIQRGLITIQEFSLQLYEIFSWWSMVELNYTETCFFCRNCRWLKIYLIFISNPISNCILVRS